MPCYITSGLNTYYVFTFSSDRTHIVCNSFSPRNCQYIPGAQPFSQVSGILSSTELNHRQASHLCVYEIRNSKIKTSPKFLAFIRKSKFKDPRRWRCLRTTVRPHIYVLCSHWRIGICGSVKKVQKIAKELRPESTDWSENATRENPTRYFWKKRKLNAKEKLYYKCHCTYG